MADRESTITLLQILRTWCAVSPCHGMGLSARECENAVRWLDDALELLKAQGETIKYMYDLLDDICKKYREETEGDGVCGLCQYDGAYIGQSGDWMNECPGFETNECFCMKNKIRKMCNVPIIDD